MKNLKLIKIFLVILVSAVFMLVATQTFAADASGEPDFIQIDANSISNENTTTGTSTGTSTDTTDTTDTTSTTKNTTSNTSLNSLNLTSNTTNTTNKLNTTNNTSNTSSYNNTDLPDTGIGETAGTMIFLIAVFAISAVYAYKKIRDYNNI